MTGNHIVAEFGKLDYLGVTAPDGKEYWLKFNGRARPGIAASHNGRKLYIVGEVQLKKTIDRSKVFAIAYTTVRDGVTEPYVHKFRPLSRPTLNLKGSHVHLVGGRFEFTETGINDR